jgi:predicted metal-dependent enzyme (double-stranded beta helix superfamily)
MPHAELLAPALAARRAGTPEPLTPALAMLVAEIDAACDSPPAAKKDRIIAALEAAVAQVELLTPDQRMPQSSCYARHLMHSDPAGRYSIVAIVWNAGQFSPPHAHHTWCAYAVCENVLEETLYAWDAASAAAQPVRKEVRSPGYGCFAHSGLDQIHRLGNSGSRPAISIHVYGVERERVGTHVNRVVQVR